MGALGILAPGIPDRVILAPVIQVPTELEKQVVVIYAGTNGYLDQIAVDQVKRYERELLDWIAQHQPETFSAILETGALAPEVEQKLKDGLTQFNEEFANG